MWKIEEWIIYSMGRTFTSKYLTYLAIGIIFQVIASASKAKDEFACFNTVFEISCDTNEVIVFDTARYGRNDTVVANRCQVPYERTCDYDVHFHLNRVCAGKQKCSLAVNTALFGDPCGYDEFLRVTYRCVPVAKVQQTCFGSNGPTFYDHGYVASPNYPSKYYMDANCYWKLSVQKRQRLTVMLMDFELDVKKGGQCSDYLEISAGERVYFKDCGSLGKQTIRIDSDKALIRFRTGRGSLAQRGFLIYFEANGPGCSDLEELDHGWAEYFIEQDILFANVTCQEGFHFAGYGTRHQLLQCSGTFWNTDLTPCVSIIPPTTPMIITTTEFRNTTATVDESGSMIGIALGVVSALLLITLLLVLALYFHKRRKNAERKLDQWRFVINNLQENTANEENLKRARQEELAINTMSTPISNVRKAGKRVKKPKKMNNKEDEWQGRNLLTSPNHEDDEFVTLDPRDMDTMLKFPFAVTSETCPHHQCSRANSKIGKYALGQSRDSQLEGFVPLDYDVREKPKRDLRYKRAKSGQWDAPGNKSFAVSTAHTTYPTPGPLIKRQFTQSAPELPGVHDITGISVGQGDIFCYEPEVYGTPAVAHRGIERSSTMTGVPVSYRDYNTRSTSRNKIRC